MASATELLVPMLMVLPAVPVPRLIVLALLPVPKLTVPVVPESIVIAEDVVDEIVPAPAKVKPVAVTAIVSIEATPVKAPPVVTLSPPFEANANVPVALPIVVFAVPVEFIEAVPPVIVTPAEPVNNPAEVIVPVPEVEMFPEVVILSPAVIGERVVPVLSQ